MKASQSTLAQWLDRETVAVLLAVTVLAVAILPSNAAALTAWIACMLWGVGVAAIRFGRPVAAASQATPILIAGGLGVALAILSSITAINPRVSLLGSIGQHTGSLFWLAVFAVFLVLVYRSRAGDLGRTVRSVTIAGAVIGVSALFDATGILGAAAFSAEPSGVMENSLSLAQVLVVALACAVSWALARKGTERVVAVGSGVIVLTGLAIADSRAAWLGAIVGTAVVLGALLARRRSLLVPGIWSAVVVVLLLAGLVGGWWMLRDGVNTTFEQSIERVSTDRTTIWRSAYAQAEQAPLLGSGSEQFSAWVTWDSEPGVSLSKTGTYDPHNIYLWWLLAAGIPGLTVSLALTWFVLQRLFALMAEESHPVAVFPVIGGIVAWGTTLLLGWTSPLAALMVAALLAVLVSKPAPAQSQVDRSDRWPFVLLAAMGALAVAGLVFLWSDFVAEYRWARAVDSGTATETLLLDLAASSNDPAFAALAGPSVSAQLMTGGPVPPAMERVAQTLERDSAWHADAAFERVQVAFARAQGVGVDDEMMAELEEALAAARRADPTSGLWDYIAAVQYATIGLSEESRSSAERALDSDLPASVRGFLEGIAAGDR